MSPEHPQVFSATPKGRYAASGCFIYDTATKKPVRKLPFLSVDHVFSRDGRHLYMLNRKGDRLYLLMDWKE